jgi:hypothetical protein
MTDKELIKQEIEKEIGNIKRYIYNPSLAGHSKRDMTVAYETLNKLLQFIDSLSEEPVNEDFEEALTECVNRRLEIDEFVDDSIKFAFIEGAEWQKQKDQESSCDVNCTPKSDDLEEAADKYAENHGFRVPYDGSNKFYDDVDVKASKEGFIAGAEWQKDKMNLLLQTEYEKGMFDLNKAMMKDAVELHIIESFNPVGTENEKPHGFTALCYNAKYPDFYTVTGQTIKVIPLKEIQQNEQDCRKKGIGGISNSF